VPRSLIHDWNGERALSPGRRVELNDETLRDGLQSPSVTDPSLEAKLRLLHLMADLGISAVTIGFPAAGPRMLKQTRALAAELVRERMPVAANAAARALQADVRPIVSVAEDVGLPIEAAIFIGASAVRRESHGWSVDGMLAMSERAVGFALREGLPVMFVLEDASRTDPETLRTLYREAIRWGVRRLCLADTSGHATPPGVERLVRFVRDEVITPSGENIALDWHGHRDRGMAVANCFAAIGAGVDRVHGTALGCGERAGNAEMELLLANLHLGGLPHGDLTRLPEYCTLASRALGLRVPANHPVVGYDAFRTASGIHAAAILQAHARGDVGLAELTYSSLPASLFGLEQRFALSPMSGHAIARHWLEQHGHDPADDQLVDSLLAAAKQGDRVLEDADAERVVRNVGVARQQAVGL
jgi:isopropylmalate/homocitrate/citramalate synthase